MYYTRCRSSVCPTDPQNAHFPIFIRSAGARSNATATIRIGVGSVSDANTQCQPTLENHIRGHCEQGPLNYDTNIRPYIEHLNMLFIYLKLLIN